MSESVIITPLEWYPQTLSPKDPDLFAAIQDFLEQQFGERHNNLGQYQRVYAAQNEQKRVIGLAGTVARMDVPMFHVGEPSPHDRAGIRDALLATDLLYSRLKHYIEDAGGKGYETFVYVKPESREHWSKFLERIGAREAHRYVVVL